MFIKAPCQQKLRREMQNDHGLVHLGLEPMKIEVRSEIIFSSNNQPRISAICRKWIFS